MLVFLSLGLAFFTGGVNGFVCFSFKYGKQFYIQQTAFAGMCCHLNVITGKPCVCTRTCVHTLHVSLR